MIRWLSKLPRASERSLSQVLVAFDMHCNPKKNETVERFKFFSRSQEPGESQEKFITDLMLLGTTCNFSDLKDSLVRDRIINFVESKTDSFAKSCLRSQILIYKDALAFVERLSYRKHELKLWKKARR